jgi:hypothetical protein
VRGSLALAHGRTDDAIAGLAESVDEFRTLREMVFLGMVLAFLAYAYRNRGEVDQARACLAESLLIGTRTGASNVVSAALPGVALLYADAGRAARAHALIAAVNQCCGFVSQSQWFADVAGPAYHAKLGALTEDEGAEAEGSVLLSDMHAEARAVLKEFGDD